VALQAMTPTMERSSLLAVQRARATMIRSGVHACNVT
jgi:hypothetical protein